LELAEGTLQSRLLKKKDNVRLVQVEYFDPNASSSWANLQGRLEDQFIWLPWNWVTYARALATLPELKQSSPDWGGPTWAFKTAVLSAAIPRPRIGPAPEGVAVISDDTAVAAERFLVARSGKVLDGIHTSFNRWLCRPVVRWFAHTPTTPNQVTFGGVVVAILAGIVLARGTYWSYVGGALLFYVAGLFDEMDGMLARIKFADSPMGTWLEGFADGLSYLLLFGGITIGLSRQHGRWELWLGAALLAGTVLSLVVTTFQRKRATTADRPNEYLGKFYRMLEDDKSNWMSRQVRQLHAFLKRGVLIIYVVIFAFLNLVPLLFYLAIFGSHLTWMIVLYYNHKFVKQPLASVPPRRIQTSQEAS
jgi:phosphatidylglycerophosphate synthase